MWILEWACVLSWPSHLKERTLDQVSLVSVLILSLILLPHEYREARCVKPGVTWALWEQGWEIHHLTPTTRDFPEMRASLMVKPLLSCCSTCNSKVPPDETGQQKRAVWE